MLDNMLEESVETSDVRDVDSRASRTLLCASPWRRARASASICISATPRAFTIYDVDAAGPHWSRRASSPSTPHDEDEDPRDTIYRMIADCKVLLVAKIGVAPQEELAALGIEAATNMHAGKECRGRARARFTPRRCRSRRRHAPTRLLAAFGLHARDVARRRPRPLGRLLYARSSACSVLERREHKKNQFSQAYLGYGDGARG